MPNYTTPLKRIVMAAQSESPVPLGPVPRDVEDLTGRTFGSLTVVGHALHVKLWVVRCTCGIYVRRTSAAEGNPANDKDACDNSRRKAAQEHKAAQDSKGAAVGAFGYALGEMGNLWA